VSEGPSLLSVDAARELILAVCARRRLASESIRLGNACGRVLAEDVVATSDLPRFTHSAMDGFALRSSDLTPAGECRLRIVGTHLAGDTLINAIEAGEALRITTGAPLPDGADTVAIKERVRVEDGMLIVDGGLPPGTNVRPRGEDYQRGEIALHAGAHIGAAQLGVLASLGLARIGVSRRPRVAVLTTGNELVMPGTALAHAQIHNSNGYSLAALLARAGADLLVSPAGERFGHVADDRNQLREVLGELAASADVIVTSGGVSAGEADFLPGVLGGIGRVHLWKVRMRPGMPLLFGEIGKTLVFGLPGNPVSSMATLLAFVLPALNSLQGASTLSVRAWKARLATPLHKRHDRTEFMRATLNSAEDGTLWVTPLARQGSGMLRGMVEADALVLIPESARELESGAVVDAYLLPALAGMGSA